MCSLQPLQVLSKRAAVVPARGQVLQAEADAAAERFLCRAFSDAGGCSSPDNNPLLRRNKLSSSNPLL